MAQGFDPILSEVMAHELITASEEMNITMKQTTRSFGARMSLARQLSKTGQRDEAHSVLAETYSWFMEGFDTADLEHAKALLDELAT